MRWFGVLALVLSGCATVHPPVLDEKLGRDPLACAHRVAQSIPPQEGRNTALNFVAFQATSCDPEPRTPPGFWSHDPDQSLGIWSGLAEARQALARADTARAIRRVRRAWSAAGELAWRENRVGAREQGARLLIEARQFDAVLGRANWIERSRERADWFDPGWARAEVARDAARLGDRATLTRAREEAASDRERGFIAAAAARGFAARGAFEEATRASAGIDPRDSLARGEAYLSLVLPLARAGRWDDALHASRSAGPAACLGLLRLDLLSLAHDQGHTRLADSLAAEVALAAITTPEFIECGELGSWSAYFPAGVRRLVRTGDLAAADALVERPREGAVSAWNHALGFVIVAVGHLDRGDRAAARAAWARARTIADSSGADGWVGESGWTMLADTLQAAGWTAAAGEAIQRALVEARRCETADLRAAALAHVAGRGPMLPAGEDARLLVEAMREANTVKRAGPMAQALAQIGATYRYRALPVGAPERAILAEIVARYPRWHSTLSE